MLSSRSTTIRSTRSRGPTGRARSRGCRRASTSSRPGRRSSGRSSGQYRSPKERPGRSTSHSVPVPRPDVMEGTMSDVRPSRLLTIVLVKPSRYDDDGYVVRHWRGVLPSNTLAAMHSLTEQVAASGVLGAGVGVRTAAYDETVHRVDPTEIARRYGPRRPSDRTVIALVAVQTNQWPRA